MPLLLSSLPDQVMPLFRVKACAEMATVAAPSYTLKGGITKSGKLDSSMTSVKLLLAAVFTVRVDSYKREEGVRRLYL